MRWGLCGRWEGWVFRGRVSRGRVDRVWWLCGNGGENWRLRGSWFSLLGCKWLRCGPVTYTNPEGSLDK